MKISTFILKLAGLSLFTKFFVVASLPVEAATWEKPIQSVGAVDIGTVGKKDKLNEFKSDTGEGFNKSFKTSYFILGAKDDEKANSNVNTNNISEYVFPLKFTNTDLQKNEQEFTFNLAFNGTPGGELHNNNNNSADNLIIYLIDITNASALTLIETFLNVHSIKPESLIPEASIYNRTVKSTALKSTNSYAFRVRLEEYSPTNRAAIVNTAVGINEIKVNGVELQVPAAIPEPSTFFGVGVGISLGAFFKQKSHKKEKAKRKAL